MVQGDPIKGDTGVEFSIHNPRAWLGASLQSFLSVKEKGKTQLVDERKFFFIETFQPVNPEGMTELEHHYFVTPSELMIQAMIKINLS